MTEEQKLTPELMTELLLSNLEHARHVENERLSFNSIYIAVVAGFFALAFDFEKPILTIFFIGILLFISLVGFLFTKRWTDVFEGHMDKAKDIARELYGEEEPRKNEDILNKYYYFSHDSHRHACKRYAGKHGCNIDEAAAILNGKKHGPLHWLVGIRTRTLFYLFYIIVVSVLAIFFIYSIYQVIAG